MLDPLIGRCTLDLLKSTRGLTYVIQTIGLNEKKQVKNNYNIHIYSELKNVNETS